MVLAITLPFLGQALHIDDEVYVRLAAALLDRPGDFLAVEQPLFGRMQPLVRHSQHPPLTVAALAGIGALAGGFEAEAPLHVGWAVFTLLAAFGAWAFFGRFSERPLALTLLFLLAPAVMVSAHTLMTDVPFLAFFLWAIALGVRAVDRADLRLAGWGSLAATLCAATQYRGLVVPVLIAGYALVTRRFERRLLPFLAVPFAALAAWELGARVAWGAAPILESSGFLSLAPARLATTAATYLAGIGGTLAFALAAAMWPERRARGHANAVGSPPPEEIRGGRELRESPGPSSGPGKGGAGAKQRSPSPSPPAGPVGPAGLGTAGAVRRILLALAPAAGLALLLQREESPANLLLGALCTAAGLLVLAVPAGALAQRLQRAAGRSPSERTPTGRTPPDRAEQTGTPPAASDDPGDATETPSRSPDSTSRDDRLVLAAGGLGLLALLVPTSLFACVRNLLVVLPFLLALLALRFPALLRRERWLPAAAAGAALGFALSASDAAWADHYRRFAAGFAGRSDVAFAGEWGFRHYLDRAGARYLLETDTDLPEGTLLLVPELASPENAIAPDLRARLVQESDLEVWNPFPLILMSERRRNCGWYAEAYGYLPFCQGRPPQERFTRYRVGPAPEAEAP